MTLNFTSIYNENYKWVVNLIKSRINEKYLADEIANDVFLKVSEHLPSFDETKCSTGLMGWIRTIAFNKIKDHYRKKKEPTKSLEDFVDEDGKEIFSVVDDCDIEREYCTQETVDICHSVISILPEPYKSVTTMFYIEDKTHDEIVSKTGSPVGTIKAQLSRARKLMKSELGIA
jgi:RNA polymerase sigma-70 factor (ECF subfamily)